MNLERITFSETRHTEKDKHCVISFISEIWKIQQTSESYQKEADP